jgi:hypothetical protein
MAKIKTVPCSVSLSSRLHARLVAVAAAHHCTIETLIRECVELGELLEEAVRVEVITGTGKDRSLRVWVDEAGTHWSDSDAEQFAR